MYLKNKTAKLLTVSYLFFGILSPSLAQNQLQPEPPVAKYNVSWDSLGNYSADSMPLGNGDIGLNLWTEQNGDVLFYISKTDALLENASPVKLAKIRVSFQPGSFVGTSFSQVLHLENGEIIVSGGIGANTTKLHIWVDAYHPAIRVEADAEKPIMMKVSLEPWRTIEQDKPTFVSADVVLRQGKDALLWYHRNDKTKIKEIENLTFGAKMMGENFEAGNENTLLSVSAKKAQRFSIYPFTATTPSIEDWKSQLERQASYLNKMDWPKTYAAHQQWWKQFWQRSYIYIDGDESSYKVTQGYVLQRFVTACAGRGAHAIKFNGTIFTVDNPAENKGKDKITGKELIEPVNADFRAWGGQYWFQNTRPIYWPMLASGDFDMMGPLFKQVLDMMPGNKNIIKQYYNHDGFYFAETANYWGGLPELKPDKPGKYTDRYFTPVLELSSMMLDYYDYTGNPSFLRDTLLPIINGGLTFFEQHFPKDDQGKLLLSPDNSIEMYWDVSNPLPDIAGLHYVLDRLLALPAKQVGSDMRSNWLRIQKLLPGIPVGTKEGRQVLLPYESDPKNAGPHNTENPELYAIYPFRIYGLDKPDYPLALQTFNSRLIKRSGCWHQDPIDEAFLGLSDQAKKDVTFNLTNSDPKLRFPAFWVRGHDYMPDEDNGGNGQLGLQKMLMQCDGKKILLLPAWPKEWNADFKLYAPFQTTVEGHVEQGKVTGLKVSPQNRLNDIKIWQQ